MKQMIIFKQRLLVLLISIWALNLSTTARNDSDSLQLPSYVLNDSIFTLNSSQNRHLIENALSQYIEHNLPIMRYDGTSFRFLVTIKINKSGVVKKIRLLNKQSFADNIVAWNDVKKIILTIKFNPAKLNNRPINFVSTFYVRLDFTNWIKIDEFAIQGKEW